MPVLFQRSKNRLGDGFSLGTPAGELSNNSPLAGEWGAPTLEQSNTARIARGRPSWGGGEGGGSRRVPTGAPTPLGAAPTPLVPGIGKHRALLPPLSPQFLQHVLLPEDVLPEENPCLHHQELPDDAFPLLPQGPAVSTPGPHPAFLPGTPLLTLSHPPSLPVVLPLGIPQNEPPPKGAMGGGALPWLFADAPPLLLDTLSQIAPKSPISTASQKNGKEAEVSEIAKNHHFGRMQGAGCCRHPQAGRGFPGHGWIPHPSS